jgi:MFS transporter, UMF1 family
MLCRIDPDGGKGGTLTREAALRDVSLLERLGLHRRELRAWAMYEWAITGFYVVIVTAVFPVYYQNVAAHGLPDAVASRNFALATSLGIVLIAVAAPLIGAITDQIAVKKRLLTSFMLLGVTGCAGLYLVTEGRWVLGLALFAVANIGVNGSTVFYDALLPHIAKESEVDRVSTGAFAVGYAGATLLLLATLLLIEQPGWFGVPEGTLPARISFLAVGAWWLVFTIPLLRRVPEPQPELDPHERAGGNPVAKAVGRIARTGRDLREYRHAFVFLLAYFVYGDGIGTIIRLAVVYGTEIGIGQTTLLGAILVVQIIGIPAAFAFGAIAGRVGAKRAILAGLAVYLGVTTLGYFMTTGVHFIVLAVLVGLVQGGTQALSRSLFASMIPRYKSGEFFGFFGVMDKFAGMMGPAVFAAVNAMTGSSRQGILSVILFFLVGGALLLTVDEDEGRRVARRAQAQASPVEDATAD